MHYDRRSIDVTLFVLHVRLCDSNRMCVCVFFLSLLRTVKILYIYSLENVPEGTKRRQSASKQQILQYIRKILFISYV